MVWDRDDDQELQLQLWTNGTLEEYRPATTFGAPASSTAVLTTSLRTPTGTNNPSCRWSISTQRMQSKCPNDTTSTFQVNWLLALR